jgi:predicted RNA-binding protein YlqC (UPF0109 family)
MGIYSRENESAKTLKKEIEIRAYIGADDTSGRVSGSDKDTGRVGREGKYFTSCRSSVEAVRNERRVDDSSVDNVAKKTRIFV